MDNNKPPQVQPQDISNGDEIRAPEEDINKILREVVRQTTEIPEVDKGINPKDRIGLTKPNMFLVSPASTIYEALAMQNGAVKYGPYNWRENKVIASVYISALLRHVADWTDGQDLAEDSGVPHLGHAKACLGIIIDALETGNLIDDRPAKGCAPELLEKWTVKK